MQPNFLKLAESIASIKGNAESWPLRTIKDIRVAYKSPAATTLFGLAGQLKTIKMEFDRSIVSITSDEESPAQFWNSLESSSALNEAQQILAFFRRPEHSPPPERRREQDKSHIDQYRRSEKGELLEWKLLLGAVQRRGRREADGGKQGGGC